MLAPPESVAAELVQRSLQYRHAPIAQHGLQVGDRIQVAMQSEVLRRARLQALRYSVTFRTVRPQGQATDAHVF